MKEIPVYTFEILKTIFQSLYDRKAMNILCLDVRGICTITDFFVIAEGNVSKHLQALAFHIGDSLKEFNKKPLRIEGKRDTDWVVIDYGDYIIHLLTPEAREKYAIERIWAEASIIDIPIQLASLHPASLSLRKGSR